MYSSITTNLNSFVFGVHLVVCSSRFVFLASRSRVFLVLASIPLLVPAALFLPI